MSVTAELAAIGVLPVVVIDDAAEAPELARALRAGGIGCAEVTLRTEAGLPSLAAMAAEGLLVGAGTVLDRAALDAAVDAGARFAVSPGFGAGIVDACRDRGVLPVPGVATSTEIMAALDAGLTILKLFPAAQLGGPAAVAALHGPFPQVRFVPSGGIDVDNAAGYALEAVLSISTSWITPRALIRERRFDEIADRARAFRRAVGR